jgi:hypothetical protein
MDLNEVGSYCSIISLVASIVIAFFSFRINNKVRDIKKKFLIKESLPSLIEDLAKNKLELLQLYDDYDNSINDIKHSMSQSRIILKNISLKLNSKEVKEIKYLILNIENILRSEFIKKADNTESIRRFVFFPKKQTTSDDIFNLYTKLSSTERNLNYKLKDFIKINMYE